MAKWNAKTIGHQIKCTVHRQIYIEKKEKCNQVLKSATENHYKNLLMESSDQTSLFKIVNTLSNSTWNLALPEHVSSIKLANHLGNFCQAGIS